MENNFDQSPGLSDAVLILVCHQLNYPFLHLLQPY
jgi:hypothetical protein